MALVFIIPRNTLKKTVAEYTTLIRYHSKYLLVILLLVLLHLIEVNVIDPFTTTLIGYDFASVLHSFEDSMVFWFTQHWIPGLLYFFVFIYIGIYPFLLWFSLLYYIIVDEKKAMKSFTLSFVIIYAIAFPFYLFFPITNVYTYFGASSALDTVIPSVEQFFYTTTTNNNCLPSLHVALSLLMARTALFTKNKRFIYLTVFCAVGVICAVIYLGIHWITDVIAGALLAVGVFFLVKRIMKES